MKINKATRGQVRRHNRELLLRIIYSGLAGNRAALAQETGLAKPTVSALVTELVEAGLLAEGGRGESTESGGKRPTLLQFVPNARQVIGVSMKTDQIRAVLTNLNGDPFAEHFAELDGRTGRAVVNLLQDVINGLVAQLDAPLLCIGIGVSGDVDSEQGIVQNAPHFGWRDFPLVAQLSKVYQAPIYIANSTEAAALGQYMFATSDEVNSLALMLVNNSVGIGIVLDGATHHLGSEIGHLMVQRPLGPSHGEQQQPISHWLGWQTVRGHIADLCQQYPDSMLNDDRVTYLLSRYAAANNDPAALILQDELADILAQVMAWVITLLHPQHITVAGRIAEMGDALLQRTTDKLETLIAPDLLQATTFSLSNDSNLVAMGAVAYTLQKELGLV